MCGVFGYIGEEKKNLSGFLLDGLSALEYRGYDSAGISTLSNGRIQVYKEIGEIKNLKNKLGTKIFSGSCGIAHTRWATHGGITKVNAHPHKASDGSFVLVHNGIVENFNELKSKLLQKSVKFASETDTEVIVRLIEEEGKKTSNFINAVRLAFKKLKGRNTIMILGKNGEIVAVRNGSPLVLGKPGKGRGLFFSSDTLSFAPFVSFIIAVDNNQLVHSKRGEIEIIDVKNGRKVKFTQTPLKIKKSKVDMEGFDHFMIKEIHESPYVIRQVYLNAKKGIPLLAAEIKKTKNIYTIASGTAGLAASQIAFYLRKYGTHKAISLVGAEAGSFYNLFEKGDVIIAPSQSGETADVLEVLEIAKNKGVKIASYINMLGSTMARMSDYAFQANAGPELCVMSTKVFISQLAWGYLLSKAVEGKLKQGIGNLKFLERKIGDYLKDKKNIQIIKTLAKKLISKDDIFLLGKGQNLAIAYEGMVKLIEGTYKHAHAIPAGDLKHFAITIMDKGVPVIVVVSQDDVLSGIMNAASEVKARGATVIGVSPKNYKIFDYWIPVPDTGETSAIANIIPLQLLAYYLTVLLGHNVDKPRNIAKSVTVK